MDQVKDVNHTELVRFARLYSFPGFVKAADAGQLTAPRPATCAVFADPTSRTYPCDTSASTWVSAMYFLEKRSSYKPQDAANIQTRLEKYADYWRIRPAYNDLYQQHLQHNKNAAEHLPDSAFAWLEVTAEGKERHLPMTNAREVKAAADWLYEHRDQASFEQRQRVALRIKTAQAHFGASIRPHEDFISRNSGRGVCSPGQVCKELTKRASATKSPALKAAYQKLAHALTGEARAMLQPSNMSKLAQLIDTLDRAAKISYSDYLPRPEEVMFTITLDKAAQAVFDHVTTVTGSVFPKEALAKVSLEDIRGTMGSEFAERVRDGLGVSTEKLAEEMRALPWPDAQAMEGLLKDAGAHAVMRKTAGTRLGFNRRQLQELAKHV